MKLVHKGIFLRTAYVGRTLSYLIIVVVIVIALLQLSYWIVFLNASLIPENQSFDYVFNPGMTVTDIANDLKQNNYLSHQYYFIFLAKVTAVSRKLQAGEYQFKGPLKPWDVLSQMVEGKVISRKITLVEGWNFQQILTKISQHPHMKHELTGLTTSEIMAKIGLPHEYPEGLFFPDTYHYTSMQSDLQLLRRAYIQMQKRLLAAWQQRDPNLPYDTSYQALIAASIIEKETALDDERALIAGVIVNRLNKRMLLQLDPTVIYGLGSRYNGHITREQLREDTPYNTYLHKGLPPTPISMPSERSIQAALNPENTDYLYFVAKGDGSHQFSKTLAEQNEAIKEYQAK
jgi:peptidoglycan lytic transglycosylase G